MPLSQKEIAARLKAMQGNFDSGKENAKTMFEKIAEGEYIGKLVGCTLDESNQGKLMIKRHHVVTEGENKGANAYDNLGLEHEFGIAMTCQWLDSLGVDIPEDMTDLPEIVKQINEQGYSCKFKVTHSKDSDFINIRILELAGDDEAAPAADDKKGKAGKDKEEAEEKAGEDTEVDIDKLERPELKALIKENKLDILVTAKMSDDDIRKAIVQAVGGAEAESEAEDKELQSLTAFCEAHDIKYTDKDDKTALIKKISKGTFKEEELDEDESALLKSIDLYDEVVEKEKKAPAKAAAGKKLVFKKK